MPKASERDLSRIGWLDYVLMSTCSCVAAYSAGMSIQADTLSWFCVILVIVGSLFSYGVRLLTLNSPWIKFDAFFYSAAVLASIFFSRELRDLMPDAGFPREMIAAGWLCWMLILGSFATWQDSTLLFQAIPALALFGLIGCYETYHAATFAFFLFLICLATLFARAHGRDMLRKAAESGYFTRGLAPGTPIPSVETTPGLALKLKRGPWRWVAGPEWALASAMAVVLISLLGAPVIHDSVSSVVGFVRITQPPPRFRNTPMSPTASDTAGQTVRIGRPYTHGVARPLLEATLGDTEYLRSETYDQYTGSGWHHSAVDGSAQNNPADTIASLERNELKHPKTVSFQLQTLRTMRLLPLPPVVSGLETINGTSLQLMDDGTYQFNPPADGVMISGTSSIPDPSQKLAQAARYPALAPYLDKVNIAPSVEYLAKSASAGGKSDYEKAQLISSDISRRIVYNLDADETPPGKDPVEYTLFTEKEGYCTAFASAMVLMSRCVGIPARYVQGYLPDARRREPNGPYVVTDADYHAWAELFFKDAGWVVFDPTLSASSKPGEGLGDTGDARPWYQRGLMLLLFNLLVVVTAFALLILGLFCWKVYRRGISLKDDVERAMVQFSRQLAQAAGVRRQLGQTSDEYVESIGPALGDSLNAARDLSARLVRAMYSAEGLGADGIAVLKRDLRAFGANLKQNPRRTES